MILLEKYINKWNDKNNKDFIDELFYLIGIGHKNIYVIPQKPKFRSQRFLVHIHTTENNLVISLNVNSLGNKEISIRDRFMTTEETAHFYNYLENELDKYKEDIEKFKREVFRIEMKATNTYVNISTNTDDLKVNTNNRNLIFEENFGRHFCPPVPFSVDEYTPNFSKTFSTQYGLYEVLYSNNELKAKLLSPTIYALISLLGNLTNQKNLSERNYLDMYFNLIHNFIVKNNDLSWELNKLSKRSLIETELSELNLEDIQFQNYGYRLEVKPLEIVPDKNFITFKISNIPFLQINYNKHIIYFDYGVYRSILNEVLDIERFKDEIQNHTITKDILSKLKKSIDILRKKEIQ